MILPNRGRSACFRLMGYAQAVMTITYYNRLFD
jgi:hypothetical protein